MWDKKQIAILVGSLLLGACYVGEWRTQSFGIGWQELAMDVFVVIAGVMPIAALGILGRPWRKSALILLVLGVGMISLAEIHSGLQEWLVVRRYGDSPDQHVTVRRWPPFGDHSVVFSPGHGWAGTE